MKISKKIHYKTYFLTLLTIFLFSISTLFHLGVIGVIVMVRTKNQLKPKVLESYLKNL